MSRNLTTETLQTEAERETKTEHEKKEGEGVQFESGYFHRRIVAQCVICIYIIFRHWRPSGQPVSNGIMPMTEIR